MLTVLFLWIAHMIILWQEIILWIGVIKAFMNTCSVVSDSLLPYGLSPTRLLCPWASPGCSNGGGMLPDQSELNTDTKLITWCGHHHVDTDIIVLQGPSSSSLPKWIPYPIHPSLSWPAHLPADSLLYVTVSNSDGLGSSPHSYFWPSNALLSAYKTFYNHNWSYHLCPVNSFCLPLMIKTQVSSIQGLEG